MQKMIFSVIALVAFSFAGMANEVKEKKVEESTVKVEVVSIVKTVEDPCVQFSFDASDAIMALSGVKLTKLQEGQLIIALYDLCDANR
jgi:hypothetical protein